MANNPYSPPTANVGEREARVAPGPMPRNVKIALAILIALQLYVIYNINFPMLWDSVTNGSLPAILLVFNLVTQAIHILAITFVSLRRHWARILEIVIFGWTVLALGMSELMMQRAIPSGTHMKRDVLATLLLLGLLAARGGATGLLFTPSANAWFKPRAAH